MTKSIIDGNEGNIEIARHGFDGRNPVLRCLGKDLFLSCHKRHAMGSSAIDKTLINFACEQPEWQSDHAGPVRQHPFDGKMGLARIGRPQQRRHATLLERIVEVRNRHRDGPYHRLRMLGEACRTVPFRH